MKRLLIGLAATFAAAGCVNQKFITTRQWIGGDTLYVAYTEHNKTLFSATTDAKVLQCKRQADNGLQCVDEQQLNTLLNAGSATASR